MKFKLGDRVKSEKFGKGTVIGFAYNGDVLIEYDKFMNGHTGGNVLVKGKTGKNGYCWWHSSMEIIKTSDKKHFKSLPSDYTGTIEVENGFIQEKEILDEAEKEYLSNLIRPFKNKVAIIIKCPNFDSEYICMSIKTDVSISLPNFKKGTMYKNMEPGKEYSLEELGLDV